MDSLPDNLIVMASHSSDVYPAEHSDFKWSTAFTNRLVQRNFTDFATGMILAQFPKGLRIEPPKLARVAGDPNRALDSEDLFPTQDFNGVQIFEKEPSAALKQQWLDESYQPFHNDLAWSIDKCLKRTVTPILIVDIHDTGNYGFDAKGNAKIRQTFKAEYGIEGFFDLVLGDDSGHSTGQGVIDMLKLEIESAYDQTGISLAQFGGFKLNEPFSGSDIIARIEEMCRQLVEKNNSPEWLSRINIVQVELNRSRLLDEPSQSPKSKEITREYGALSTALNKAAYSLAS